MQSQKIAVLGSGGWGTALAILCNKNGHKVSLWSAFPEEIEAIRVAGENCLLKGIPIPPEIVLTADLKGVKEADLIILAVPSFAVKSTCEKLKPYLRPGTPVVNVAKGFCPESLTCLSDIMEEILCDNPIAVLSGPSHAEEVGRGIPTSVVCAARSTETAERIQDLLMCEEMRVYTSDDIVGVELGGALKNIIALAAGICHGMKLGDNTIAALMTRGLAEIARLGEALGANAATFMGLSGVGDMIVTCTSLHSRNRRFGVLIGEGHTAEEGLRMIGMTVEGYHAAKLAYRLAEQAGVEMPITQSCYRVLYEGLPAEEALRYLMTRPKKSEPDGE